MAPVLRESGTKGMKEFVADCREIYSEENTKMLGKSSGALPNRYTWPRGSRDTGKEAGTKGEGGGESVIKEKEKREQRERAWWGIERERKNILWIREWLRISRSVPPGGDFLRLCSSRYIRSPLASLNRALRRTCRKCIPRTAGRISRARRLAIAIVAIFLRASLRENRNFDFS